MTPSEKAWRAATGAQGVLSRVERRLVAAGAITELRQLSGLSASEVDVLLWAEREDECPQGCAPSGSHPAAGLVA